VGDETEPYQSSGAEGDDHGPPVKRKIAAGSHLADSLLRHHCADHNRDVNKAGVLRANCVQASAFEIKRLKCSPELHYREVRLASYVRLRRAAPVDPAHALRAE